MLSAFGEFLAARDTVSYADDAITELELAMDAFFRSDFAELVVDFDANTGEKVKKIRLKQPFPRLFNRKVTEALTNTKHAFDQASVAAFRLTESKGSGDPYFPWGQSPNDVKGRLKRKGFDERLWDTFISQEPYPRSNSHAGGDDVVRAIASMANEKHTVGLTVNCEIASTEFADIDWRDVGGLKMMSPTWDSVKNEAELIRWTGSSDVGCNYTFRFNVVFDNALLPEPLVALLGLKVFSAKAKAVIEALQTRCVDIIG